MSEIYKNIISPWLDKRDSETWHVRAREALHLAELNPVTLWLLEKIAVYKSERFCDERLKVVVGGVEFDNPVMVGAGWDKQGRAVGALHRLGFSGVEVGSVLARPQAGNLKPRQWMLAPGVAMNRLGFNSPGMEAVAGNLKRYQRSGIPIGISIGKNKDVANADAAWAHAVVAERLYDEASYFAVNVSSPNTPGLRELQDKKPLNDIVQAINSIMDSKGGRKPLFVKIAPDLTNTAVDDVIQVVLDNGLTGIIATNTTDSGRLKAKYGRKGEMGGISGDNPDFRRMATGKIAHIRKVAGDSLEIIGVGGVKNTATALEKIRSGAKLIQVVTAIRGEGLALPGKINRGLVEYLEKEGISRLSEIVGTYGYF
ncbi:MAG: quinone-dependent dihydroorotate dehydrogenase [bacterium]|nr:quinone-dependent dihydroorotate dehydrogenase [bacterium]